MNVNKVILVGRLTRDPEIRTTPSGQTVATVGLATNNYWTKDGQKQERTEFHNIVLWGKLAEIAGQYLTKGQEAYFEGRLQSRTYTGKDNIERKVTEVVAENMQLGSRAGAGGGSAPRNVAASGAAASNVPSKAPAEEEIPTINLDDDKEIKIEDVPF
ncbi:MAG: single-stranded DNA-binding protein [Candidatus Moraniibacteriota bacterium]